MFQWRYLNGVNNTTINLEDKDTFMNLLVRMDIWKVRWIYNYCSGKLTGYECIARHAKIGVLKRLKKLNILTNSN